MSLSTFETVEARQAFVADFLAGDVGRRLGEKDIVLTVCSGRSGTKLLTVLLDEVAGVAALHEPMPMLNLELRQTVEDPGHGLKWLAEQKLPVIANAPAALYVETSHLYCKGFIELLFILGVRPRFIILRRPAAEVAGSLFKMDVIPGRSENGKLVLLQPSDSTVLPLPGSDQMSDYQLCYWYALEMERRQVYYSGLCLKMGLPFIETSLDALIDWDGFARVADFVRPSPLADEARGRYAKVIAFNQNPVSIHTEAARQIPHDADAQRCAVEDACAPYFPPLA